MAFGRQSPASHQSRPPSNLLATSESHPPPRLEGDVPAELEVTKKPAKLPLPPLHNLDRFLDYAENERPYRPDHVILPGDIRTALTRAVDHYVLTDELGTTHDWMGFIATAEATLETEIRERSGYQWLTIQTWEQQLAADYAGEVVTDSARATIHELFEGARQRAIAARQAITTNVVALTESTSAS